MSDTEIANPPATPETTGTTPVTARRSTAARVAPLIGWAVLLLVLFLTPVYVPGEWLSVLCWIMAGGVAAMGLTMLIGQAGQFSLGQAFFLLLGGVTYTVLAADGDAEYIGFGLPPLVALIGTIIISGLAGAAFAPISGRLRGIYLGVASLSLVFLGYYLSHELPMLAGSASSGRYAPTFSVPGFDFGETNPQLLLLNVPMGAAERQFWLFAGLTVIAYLVGQGAMKGRVGRGWRAVRDNEAVATVMGVSVPGEKAKAFAISSAYGGLAGVMVVWWYSGLMKPDEAVELGTYSTYTTIALLAMCVIGGLGSLGGAIAGSALVFGLPLALPLLTGSNQTVDASGTAFTPIVITNLVFGILIVLIVLFEPRGLAGLGTRLRNLIRR
ncbi:branched-chain amino acid ABC transporter permease [Kribbia dieselivorans]|uniref:branched-chain amino acid ABC transporter permease n=1 Tax=Kribbia dieselivorans TaxID=331526 RepID=UPI0008395CC4|nr:branched-chain amino acid ABC transporter permease [Kribbia dieselivorans]